LRGGPSDFAGLVDSWLPKGAQASEPTLEYLSRAFGAKAKEAAGRAWWGAEVVDYTDGIRAVIAEGRRETEARLGFKLDRKEGERSAGPRRESALRSMWSKLANAQQANAMELVAEVEKLDRDLAGKFKEALDSPGSPLSSWAAPELAARMFGFGTIRGAFGQPEAADASGLREHGDLLRKTADRAVRSKSVARLCEMALGRWPKVSLDEKGEPSESSDVMNFAFCEEPWAPGQGYSFRNEEAPAGPLEPSLGLLCKFAGAGAIQALGGLSWGALAKERYAEKWRGRGGMSTDRNWSMPSGPCLKAGAVEGSALAAGVPAYALGLEPVPAQRWLQEPTAAMLEKCPDLVWGGLEEARRRWVSEARARRAEISEARLCASYSDDPSCRRSESDECHRMDLLVDAREALLDMVARWKLPDGDPFKMDAAAASRSLEAISKRDGPWRDAPRVDREGHAVESVFARLCVELGVGSDWPSDAKELARMLPSLVEAREIEASLAPGAQAGMGAARSKRL
jgi:hypothetical protein